MLKRQVKNISFDFTKMSHVSLYVLFDEFRAFFWWQYKGKLHSTIGSEQFSVCTRAFTRGTDRERTAYDKV
jgi:hypothetical protein